MNENVTESSASIYQIKNEGLAAGRNQIEDGQPANFRLTECSKMSGDLTSLEQEEAKQYDGIVIDIQDQSALDSKYFQMSDNKQVLGNINQYQQLNLNININDEGAGGIGAMKLKGNAVDESAGSARASFGNNTFRKSF